MNFIVLSLMLGYDGRSKKTAPMHLMKTLLSKYKLPVLALGLWTIALSLIIPEFQKLRRYQPPESDILACYPEYNIAGLDFSEDLALRADLAEKFTFTLQNSIDVNTQVVGVLLLKWADILNHLSDSTNFSPDGQIESLYQIAIAHSENKMATVHLLSKCLENSDHPRCNIEIERMAIATDGGNGVIWSMVSAFRALKGDSYGAMTAMRQASTSPEFYDYYPIYVEIFNNSIPLADESFQSFLKQGLIPYAGFINLNNTMSISDFCGESAADDSNVANACLNFGIRMQQQSSSMIGSAIGSALQEISYRALGEIEEANRIDEFFRSQSSIRFGINTNEFGKAGALMTHDENLQEYWIQSWIEDGEFVAANNLIAEAKRLTADPDYKPCEQSWLHFEFPYFYYGNDIVTW